MRRRRRDAGGPGAARRGSGASAGSGAPAPAPSVATWSELTGPLAELTIRGADPALQRAIAALFRDQLAKPLDRAALRDALEHVTRLGPVDDVVARGVQRADGVELVLEVTPLPVLRKLTAVEVGGAAISLGFAAQGVGGTLVPSRIDELTAALRDRYLSTGYFAVEAAWRRVPVAGGVEVVIEVTPGPRSTVAAVRFTGNAGLATGVLAAHVAATLVVGEPALVGLVTRAERELAALYWDRGYANVRVTAPELVPGANELVFAIEEGPRFKIGKVTIESKRVPANEHAALLAAFAVKRGDVFNRSAIVAGNARINAALAAKYPGAEVLPNTRVDVRAKRIDLTLEIGMP